MVDGWDIQVIPLFQKVRGRLFSIRGTTARVEGQRAGQGHEVLEIDLAPSLFRAGRLGNSARMMVIICGRKIWL